MQVQLLTNEAFVKSLLPIDQNLAGELLGPAMMEAQRIDLENVLGSCLLRALEGHEEAGDWTDYPAYEDLKDECQFYLAYRSIVRVIPMVSFKIANAGTVMSNDEHIVHASREERNALIADYEAKGDYFCYKLQRWTLDNAAQFPELDACACEAIRSNLRSMASCGIWLGGPRG